MMKKELLIIIICVAVLLSACSPRLVGEAKAKEAGLAFINKVFDVNETKHYFKNRLVSDFKK